jgi:hypothetical protein
MFRDIVTTPLPGGERLFDPDAGAPRCRPDGRVVVASEEPSNARRVLVLSIGGRWTPSVRRLSYRPSRCVCRTHRQFDAQSRMILLIERLDQVRLTC